MKPKVDFLTGPYVRVAAGLILSAFALNAQLVQADFVCSSGTDSGAAYDIVWDGWKGILRLFPPRVPGSGTRGSLTAGGRTIGVRYRILADPQTEIDGRRGPGYRVDSAARHRIVFWVDFDNTPGNLSDDQQFDGYMMTQTRNAIAGVTWWNGMVFGFYATNKQCIVG